MAAAPRVLIFLLSGAWTGIARLPRALTAAGFQVATLSPVGSYLSLTRHAQRHVTIPPTANPVEFFVRVASEAQPDLLIPGCNTAALFLQNFERAYRDRAQSPNIIALLALIRRSLGNPAGYPATSNKNTLLDVAREAGLRIPPHIEVRSLSDAIRFADTHTYPIVLKGEQGSGGNTVRICHNPSEIDAGLRAIETTPLTMPQSADQHQRVVTQKHIEGTPAMQVFCAFEGQLLEHIQVLKQTRHPDPTGPSSVVRFIEHAEMHDTTRVLIEKLGFSGFGSFDFMIEQASNDAYLIEINPRPCPATHIGHHVGRNLAHALWCRIAEQPYAQTLVAKPPECIALFPQEWQRDPQSPALSEFFHDVPWDDRELLRALLQ